MSKEGPTLFLFSLDVQETLCSVHTDTVQDSLTTAETCSLVGFVSD